MSIPQISYFVILPALYYLFYSEVYIEKVQYLVFDYDACIKGSPF